MLSPFVASLVLLSPALAHSNQPVPSTSAQTVLSLHPTPAYAPQAMVHGRFIHLTDLHPDPFYRTGTSEDEACHFDKKKKKKHKGGKGKKGKGKGKLVDGESGDDEVAGADSEEDEQADTSGLAKKKDKPRKAGYWGLPISDCDSPLTLVNATFDWLEANFRDQVDFVVWTGDNARHDIDTRVPRSLPEILNLNRYILDRMQRAFGEKTTLVASIGNNDIYPHNVMFPGPSRITQSFLNLWAPLIPEHHAHTFARGGYYSVEPPSLKGDLLLVSLNSIYFYSRNTVVDGCPPFDDDLALFSGVGVRPWLAPTRNITALPPSPSSPEAAAQFSSFLSALSASPHFVRDIDPGTEQLLWLEQQLVLAKARGMQVYLTGHVPASAGNWYEGCWREYSRLVGEYGGTVLGQLFGHANVDAFSFVTAKDARLASASSAVQEAAPHAPSLRSRLPSRSSLYSYFRRSSSPATSPASTAETDIHLLSVADDLFASYASLPPRHKTNLDDYNVVHTNPSVIPTYLPGVRVWEFNTTRAAAAVAGEEEEETGGWREWLRGRKGKKGKGKKGKGKKGKKPPPRREERFARAPSRTNTFLTPLAYTQYYLPEAALDAANAAAAAHLASNGSTSAPPPPSWHIEYTTLSSSAVAARLLASSSSSRSSAHQPPPNPDPLLLPPTLPPPISALLARPPSASRPHDLRRLLKKLRVTPFDALFPSPAGGLTVGNWVEAARRLVEGGKEGREWRGYRERMGVGSGEL